MIGRATLDDISTPEGRRMLGFEPYKFDMYVNEGERKAFTAANDLLGFAA